LPHPVHAPFHLAGYPPGSGSITRPAVYFIDQPATFLSALTIDNLKPADVVTFPESTIKTTIKTYDGLVASIQSTQSDWINHVTISFGTDEAILVDSDKADTIRQEVADLNSEVANRVVVIPVAKYYLLDKKPEELLEDKQGESAEADPN
jgi:hypothetical protein